MNGYAEQIEQLAKQSRVLGEQDLEIVNQVDRVLCLIQRLSEQIKDLSKRVDFLERDR